MADPKIRYDILANAEGEEDVRRLANELEKLDDAIDPTAAARAKALAAEIRTLADKKAAVEDFLRALVDSNSAATALDAARTAADRLGRTMQGVEKPTRAQAGQLEKVRDAANKAQTAYTAKTAALNTARVAVERLGLDTQNLGTKQALLNTALQSTRTQAAQLATSYQQTAATAAAAAATQVSAQGKVKTAAEGLTDTYRRLQGIAALAIGGGIFGSLIKDVSQTADEFSNLQARIRLVTGEGAAFDQAFQGVADIANATNTRLETTGTLFARIAQAGKDIGVSQQDALKLTETINQAIAVSGGSAQAADAAITQLIQGLQSGVLRGEEFNSVVEQSPRLAKALSDGLGVTIGELRKLAQQGKLTADVVIQALQGQSTAVAEEFGKLPPTVGRALTQLSNNWTLYVGEVDKANGISEAAAKIITALADNLDTLATVLFTVGKAAAAYKALQLAQTFLGVGNAAKVATAQVAGLAAAQTSATAATAGTAAAAGRFAAILGGLKTFTLVGILANYKEIGTAIGEGIAKLTGWGKVLEENERKIRETDERLGEVGATARAVAETMSELDKKVQAARDASLALSDGAKDLVQDFEKLDDKGKSASQALEKLAKSLELSDAKGIFDAVAALDALAIKGQITGDQLRDTLGAALKDLDLGAFEVQARTAFDGSEQGVRRLTAALDAMNDEALRRAGTSVDELRSGFSKAATSAINDVDKLADALKVAGADATATGRLLSAALNKANDAATTERAVQAVITRLEELAKQGKISGEQLTEGFEEARKKLDELKPGIDSLTEAYKTFGLSSRAELQALADKNRTAWQLIKNDATLTLAQKQTAFKQYAESAISANGGVISSEIKLEAAIQQVQVEVDKTGKAIVKSMGEADKAVEKTTKLVNQLGREVNAAGEEINQMVGSLSGISTQPLRAQGSSAGPSVLGETGSSDFTVNKQVPVPPGYYYSLTPERGAISAGTDQFGQGYGGYFVPIPGYRPPNANNPAQGAFGGYAGSQQQRDDQANAGNTIRVELVFNKGGPAIPVTTTPAYADQLLRELEEAQRGLGA